LIGNLSCTKGPGEVFSRLTKIALDGNHQEAVLCKLVIVTRINTVVYIPGRACYPFREDKPNGRRRFYFSGQTGNGR
jgi:hypothetical protein